MTCNKNIVVIGGGASGFFAAINCAVNFPDAHITIIEKSNKLLSKVRVSGGGRCNVTNHCLENSTLIKNYPRGEKELKQVFAQFSVQDTFEWFNKRGVKLKIENDGRVFPVSNSSETIIECFISESQKYSVKIQLNEELLNFSKTKNGSFELNTTKTHYTGITHVIVASGGHPHIKNYLYIQQQQLAIDDLIPSLFTFNFPKNKLTSLMGLSVKSATVKIIGSPHAYTGPLLITHWGISGPAVLKLSAYAAEYFFKNNYHVTVSVNWSGELNEDMLKKELEKRFTGKSLIVNSPLFDLPKRLWEYLVEKSEIPLDKPWNELSKKKLNKLTQTITNDTYEMQGKTTFKEEFVTAGGVNLKEINFKTMESKKVSGLYFCGEVLNIDGITGGFNFQNAWSTAWIAAKLNTQN